MSAEPLIRREELVRDARPATAPYNPALAGVVEPQRRFRPAARDFEFHPRVFALMGGGFAAFVGLMAANFRGGHGMPLVLAICAVCLIGYFAVPYAFSKVETGDPARRDSWVAFMRKGVMTGSGHASGGAVLAQALIMPAMLVLWGMAVLVIKSMAI